MWAMVKDSMASCSFVPWGIDQHIEIISAATGWTYSAHEAQRLAERIATLGRIFNLREGITSAQDQMPKRMFEGTPTGALQSGGVNREKMEQAVKTFYGMMGWDEDTGVPRRSKLVELGIEWAADSIPAGAAV
jgi:aldehyde:ferredoxin oxidoreductase